MIAFFVIRFGNLVAFVCFIGASTALNYISGKKIYRITGTIDCDAKKLADRLAKAHDMTAWNKTLLKHEILKVRLEPQTILLLDKYWLFLNVVNGVSSIKTQQTDSESQFEKVIHKNQWGKRKIQKIRIFRFPH